MAELVASIVSQAIQTTSGLLFSEAASVRSVRDDVERLRAEHTRIRCFLRDADHKHCLDERVLNWISEVRDLSCDIEDLIETSSAEFSSPFSEIFYLRQMRSQIDSLRTKMGDVLRSKQAYGIELDGQDEASRVDDHRRGLRRRSDLYDDDDEIVCSGGDVLEALKSRLMMVEDRLCVVSIVGMGGLGKTTLAKRVYNHCDVRLHFDCCVWVYVSQNSVPRDILSQVLVEIGFGSKGNNSRFSSFESFEEKRNLRKILRGLEERELVESIKFELAEKRYLIVLDDIWRVQAWESVKAAFPRGRQGSKILFTTRNKEVAFSADPFVFAVEPPLLNLEESFELLTMKAFGGGDCPLEFETSGKEMVRKCGGLPLAIVVLGGLLRAKRSSVHEWKAMQRDANCVNSILALSYHDLPYYLKPCFLYSSSFPEDREIPKKTLIQLWIAEGFVEVEEEMMLEAVAERYLDELVNRCMFQVSKRDNSGGNAKAYTMHDLMREFCVSQAKSERFFEIIRRQGTMTSTLIRSRRIAIHAGCNFDGHHRVQPRLRSLLCFAVDGFPLSCLRDERFRLLRSLEIGSNRFRVEYEMLKKICELVHLRYLGLKGTGIHKLPDSIGNLRRLQTIDLRDNWELWILPTGISRLTHLKRLLISALRLNYNNSWMSSTVFRMNNLRYFSLGNHKTWIRFDSLIKLTNLENLRIEFTSSEEVKALLDSSIIKSDHLRSLVMEIPFGNTFPSLRSLSHCRNLSSLSLEGKLENNACRCRHVSLQFLPPSIEKLTLKQTCIDQDPMGVLEKLPNLRLLRLSDEACSGSEMVCSQGGFPKLETLQLCRLSSLKEWRVERDAMPNLRRLEIEDNSELVMIPEGLRFVASIRRLTIVDMTKRFEDRLRVNEDGIEGEDLDKVSHIACISFVDTRKLHSLNDYRD